VVPTTTKGSTTTTTITSSLVVSTINSTIGVHNTSTSNFESRHHLQPIRTSTALAI